MQKLFIISTLIILMGCSVFKKKEERPLYVCVNCEYPDNSTGNYPYFFPSINSPREPGLQTVYYSLKDLRDPYHY